MKRRALFPAMLLVLATLACNLSGGATPTPTAVGPSPTPTAVGSYTPTPVGPITPTPTAVSSADEDLLRNGTYFAPFFARTVTLTDGVYTESSGYSVRMLGLFALGDLNGDGVDDAAIILVENDGGSGSFESLVVLLKTGGAFHQAGQAELGDRFAINSVAILSGQIVLDMLVDGPSDPLCCPSQPEVQTYRLVDGYLWLLRQTAQTPGPVEHEVNIASPADRSTVADPFTVTGSVTVTPPEGRVTRHIFLPDGTDVNAALVTLSGTPGGMGAFSFPIDLTLAGISGTIIIQVQDLNGGTTPLDLDSVVLDNHIGSGSLPTASPAQLIFIMNANCRKGPGPAYDVATAFEKGKRVEAAGRNDPGTWWLVKIPSGGTCWVADSTADKSGDFGSLAVAKAPPLPETPVDFTIKTICDPKRSYFKVNLFWTGAAGASGFRIYRNGSLLATVAGNSTGYTDGAAPLGIDLLYALEALNAYGHSAQVTQTVPACK